MDSRAYLKSIATCVANAAYVCFAIARKVSPGSSGLKKLILESNISHPRVHRSDKKLSAFVPHDVSRANVRAKKCARARGVANPGGGIEGGPEDRILWRESELAAQNPRHD